MKIGQAIATLGPLGYLPYIPGTAASVFGLIISWCLNNFLPREIVFWVIVFLIFLGMVSANIAEKNFKIKDDPRIVIDELAGMLIASYSLKHWIWLILAFGLFRFLDIKKILGIKQIQKLPGGLGIVADDLLAAIYTVLIIRLLYYGKLISVAY